MSTERTRSKFVPETVPALGGFELKCEVLLLLFASFVEKRLVLVADSGIQKGI